MVQCHDMPKTDPLYMDYNQYRNDRQRFIRQKKMLSSNAQVSRNTLHEGIYITLRFLMAHIG